MSVGYSNLMDAIHQVTICMVQLLWSIWFVACDGFKDPVWTNCATWCRGCKFWLDLHQIKQYLCRAFFKCVVPWTKHFVLVKSPELLLLIRTSMVDHSSLAEVLVTPSCMPSFIWQVEEMRVIHWCEWKFLVSKYLQDGVATCSNSWICEVPVAHRYATEFESIMQKTCCH